MLRVKTQRRIRRCVVLSTKTKEKTDMMKRWASVSAPALAMVAALAMTPAAVQAQEYPAQDIHMICAFPPGSGADVLVRYFAEKVRPLTGKNVIVENRSGAGGNIAQEYVGRSKPDGLTIFVHAGSAIAANRWMFKSPAFTDIGKTFQIAATINRQPFMLVVDAKSPYKTVAELTEAMRKKGDKATYASAAPTGTIMGEIYKDVRSEERRVGKECRCGWEWEDEREE